MALVEIPIFNHTVSLSLPFICLGLWIGYNLGLVLHRLYLSPIAGFPGPKLAAVTYWYEFYYDVVLGGQYTFRIIELHKQYGPVVRINPRELHFYPPQFYDEIYAGPMRRRDRWDRYTRGFGMPGAGASTNPHDLHKARRAALSPYFSMQSVRKLQVVIEEKADLMMSRVKGFGQKRGRKGTDEKQPLNLEVAFAAYAYGGHHHCRPEFPPDTVLGIDMSNRRRLPVRIRTERGPS